MKGELARRRCDSVSVVSSSECGLSRYLAEPFRGVFAAAVLRHVGRRYFVGSVTDGYGWRNFWVSHHNRAGSRMALGLDPTR